MVRGWDFKGVGVMRLHMGGIFLIIAILLFPLSVHAADFGAEIVDVDGTVVVIQKMGGKKIPAKPGLRVEPGDVIETAKGAEAEILYDDGNVTRLDEETRLEITKLSVESDKTRESVLHLAYGRVKNSVSKLVTTKSKFEVNTKTVTGGVTGTPPWVVNVVGGKDATGPVKTEIDLLKGEKGGVFVRGTDPKASTIILTPGTRTVAQMGAPPLIPFPISAARMNELQAKMPITTLPAVRQEKRQQLDTKPVELSKDKKEEKKGEVKEEAKKSDLPANGEKKESSATSPDNAGGAGVDSVPTGGAGTAGETPGAGANGGNAGTGPVSETPKGVGSALAMDYITHVVSVAPTTLPAMSVTGQSTDTQVTQGTNAIAGASTGAASATTRVRVQLGIVYK